MEFFGITFCGPQVYMKDIMRDDYKEPMNHEEAEKTMEYVKKTSTCPKNIERPDISIVRSIDCYTGRVNGFAYGSMLRFDKMKKKGVIHPTGPADMYRIFPSTSMDYGNWVCDPALAGQTWQHNEQRFPAPLSPNVYILDTARKNNKYATFF